MAEVEVGTVHSSWVTALGDLVEVYRAEDGWRWRVVAANGEKLGGGEAHTEPRWAAKAALRYHAPVTARPALDTVGVAQAGRQHFYERLRGRMVSELPDWDRLSEPERAAWMAFVEEARNA